ncbi:DHHW family protein [Bacillus massiliigorillae]|uniref:DHHW family protein n=1 Tax=Bacillus massiliigorillae TaxID=1243664 RepID=UPI00039ED399|nr:DHHW family protein [Bacillus massiliigorillae]
MSLYNKIIIGIFLCFIAGIAMLNVVSTDRGFSEKENRPLMQLPKFSLESFFSGSYTEDFEEYMTDQFTGKEFWLSVKAKVEKMLLKQENHGIYIGKDGFLLERFNKPSNQLMDNVDSINYFAKKATDISSYFLLVPTSIAVNNDKLPPFAPNYSQREVIQTVNDKLSSSIAFIDVYKNLLEQKDEYIYFKTDHHWTMRGAYLAYEKVAPILNIAPYPIKEFSIEKVSSNFLGTFYNKVNNTSIRSDSIEVFKPCFDVTYRVDYDDGQVSSSLYNEEFLRKRDQYSYFLNGNHSTVKITSSVKNGRKIAVIKDSYAHAFIPFLANHFEEIFVIDLRYNHSNIYQYLNEQNINEVLFLYNIVTFSTDTNLIWLRQ